MGFASVRFAGQDFVKSTSMSVQYTHVLAAVGSSDETRVRDLVSIVLATDGTQLRKQSGGLVPEIRQ